VIFKLSGLVNVFVFMLTRPGLLLFRRIDSDRVTRKRRLGRPPLPAEIDIPLEVIRVGRPSGSRTSPPNTGSASTSRDVIPETPSQNYSTQRAETAVEPNPLSARVASEPPQLPHPRFTIVPAVEVAFGSLHLTSQWFDESDIASQTQRGEFSDEDIISERSDPRLAISSHRRSWHFGSPPAKLSTSSAKFEDQRAKSASPAPSTFLDL
jgi:hypothetical protein